MNRNNKAVGALLILLGIFMFLRNYNIKMGSLISLFFGLGLFCAYFARKEQPYIIFGSIFTAIGLIAVLRDIRILRVDITFEAVLIALGIVFILIYYTKGIRSFIIPGIILPAVSIYIILLKFFNDRYVSSSIFLLLGFAFYAIYFIAYMGSSEWPLVFATILLIVGILSYAADFRIISWKMVVRNKEYIMSVAMIAAGLMIIAKRIRKG